MARPQLSALLEPRGNEEGTVKVGEAPPTPVEVVVASPVATQVLGAKAEREMPKREARGRPPKTQKPSADFVPPYLRYERKEARLRTDQLTGLTLRARQLNKTKDADSDRITDNTLIRIAVDLLLSRADELVGGDEAALRSSLGI